MKIKIIVIALLLILTCCKYANTKIFKDKSGRFSFAYDSSWEVNTKSTPFQEGKIVSLISPQLTSENANLPEGIEYIPADFILIYCAGINSNCVRQGGWTGMREYKNLDDFLNDSNVNQYSGTKKIQDIRLGDQSAYEVTRDPSNIPAVMAEHNGIFILEFPDSKNDLNSPSIQQILSSFRFTQ